MANLPMTYDGGGDITTKTVSANGISWTFWKCGNLKGVTSNQGSFSSNVGKSTSLCPIASFPEGYEFNTLLAQDVGVMFSWNDVYTTKLFPLTINSSLGIYSNNTDAVSGQTLRGFGLLYK